MLILRPPIKKQIHRLKIERVVLRREAAKKRNKHKSGLLEAARGVRNSLAHGFAQLASLGLTAVPNSTVIRSENDAIREDWVKVGGDMEVAARSVQAQAREEASTTTE